MSLSDRLRIRFACRGVAGEVLVRYGLNRDRARWGFPLLGDAAVADTDGFPVCEAVVDYPVEGYGSYLGWMQVLDIADETAGVTESSLDLPPMFSDPVTPFIFFGPAPRFFDAPAVTSDKPVRLQWSATSYLCAAGHVLMSPLVTPVAAFTWGFDYDGGRPVNVQSPRLAEPAAWTEHRQFLGGTLPGWDFAIEPPQQEIVGA